MKRWPETIRKLKISKMKVLPRGIRNNYQTEIQITIRIQPTLQYETRNKYLLKTIGIQISQIFGLTGRQIG